MNCHAGHFADTLFRERVERGTSDGQVIALDNRKFIDLHLLTRAANQNTLLLKRTDQFEYATDIIDGGTANLLGTLHHDLRDDTVTGKQLLNQCAIFLITDEMAASYSAAAGFYCTTQKTHGAGLIVAARFHGLNAYLRIIREQLGDNVVIFINHAL